MLVVTTESGTKYEIEPERIRRVGGDPMRRDEEWLSHSYISNPVLIGQPMVIHLEPLGEGNVTVRTTSPVVNAEIIKGEN